MKNIFCLIAFFIFYGINAQQAGMLNEEFSENGWDASVYANDNGFSINKTIVQPDGKLLVCAKENHENEGHQAVVIRYNTNGSLDSTFGGGDGMVRSRDDDSINFYTQAAGMALQSNGKIIIAGDVLNSVERIFRLTTDGSLDLTFGNNGVVDLPRTNDESIYQVSIQSDDKIVVAGRETRTINGVFCPHVFLWRFTADGSLDSSFGNNGVVSYHFISKCGLGENYLQVNDLLILPDDSIVVNQSFAGIAGYSVMFKKFLPNGTSDHSYGINGEAARTEIFEGANFRNSSSSLQEDGAIVFSFTSFEEENNYSESVFRVSAEGFFDHSLHIDLQDFTLVAVPLQVLVHGDKIYLSKKEHANIHCFNTILCYDLTGNPISTFGENGIATINQNAIPSSMQSKASISEDGDIYVVSYLEDSLNENHVNFLVSNILGFAKTLSVQDDFENQIVLAPNPTSGLVHISNFDQNSVDKIEVIDLLGKSILSTTAKISTLDLSEFTAGVYIIRIQIGKSRIEKKVVKK